MEIIYTETGEVKTGRGDVILKAHGIGSCVVITAYHPGRQVGVMAHVMLPGSAPAGKDIQRTRYAVDAIDEIIERMRSWGVYRDDIEVCLAGGGNVLKNEDDIICGQIIGSVTGILRERNIKITARALGGTLRRTVSLDINTGTVLYTEGDGEEHQLTQIHTA